MARFVEIIRGAAGNPVEAIQAVIAITVFFIGLYIASPWFVSSSASAIAVSFQDNLLQQAIVGITMVVPTLPILLSFFFEKFHTITWYTRSTIAMFVSLLFIVLIRILAVGLTPVTWVPTLALALILGVCHLYWKAK